MVAAVNNRSLVSFDTLMAAMQRLWNLFGPGNKNRARPGSATVTDSVADVVERLREMRNDFEQATVSIGFIGESGSGKSSLVNAIVGRPVARVGALIETTSRPQEVVLDGVRLVDLPGCGTPTWPRETYIEKLQLREKYDAFVLVTASRLKECDAYLYKKLAIEARKPFFIVRSHFDLAVAAHGDSTARSVIVPHIRSQLGTSMDTPVYLVSSVGEQHFELENLILAIQQALPEWKQVRFTMAAHSYGLETLARKREAAEKFVGIYAGLSAANALNPIPGLDVSVDVGLLATMARHVIASYGLTTSEVAALESEARNRAAMVQGLREVADRLAPYLTEKFVVTALRKMGTETMVKSSTKWVPLVGTLLSAGLGYRLTYRFGAQLVDECENASRQVIAACNRGAQTKL